MISNRNSALMEKAIKKITGMSRIKWLKLVGIDLFIIIFVSSCTSYEWLLPVNGMFLLILSCSLFAVKHYISAFGALCDTMLKEGFHISSIRAKIDKSRNSSSIAIFSFFIIAYFGVLGVLQVHTDISFWDLLIILIHFSFSVFVSMIGYALYFELPYLLFASKKVKKNEYWFSYSVPSSSKWITAISDLCNFYNLCFLGIGALFIIAFAFFTFSPYWGVPITKQTNLGYLMNTLCWATIFIAIGVVLPIVNIFEWRMIKFFLEQSKDQKMRTIKGHILLCQKNQLLQEEKLYGLQHMILELSPSHPPRNYIYSILSFFIWIGSLIGSGQAIILLCSPITP